MMGATKSYKFFVKNSANLSQGIRFLGSPLPTNSV